jgi:hypothetical protein
MRQCEDYDWLIRHYSFSSREIVLYGFPRERGGMSGHVGSADAATGAAPGVRN